MKKFFIFIRKYRAYSLHLLIGINAVVLWVKMPENRIIKEKNYVYSTHIITNVVSQVGSPDLSGRGVSSVSGSQPLVKVQAVCDYQYMTVDDVPMLSCGEGLYYKRGDYTQFGRVQWIGKDFFETDTHIVKTGVMMINAKAGAL